MTTAQGAQYGVPVDEVCDVPYIGPVPGSRNLRIWAIPRGSSGLIFQFDLPSGTFVGRAGRLQGRRHGTPVGLLEEVARNCGLDIRSTRKHDFLYEDGLKWTPETVQAISPPASGTRKTYDPGKLPVSVSISANSIWSFRDRKIEVVSSTGDGLDAVLQVKVVQAGQGRRGMAKKVSVRTLLSRYTPV